MSTYISLLYLLFKALFQEWQIFDLLIFALVVPCIILVLSMLFNLHSNRFAKADRRLIGYLKRFSYISHRYMFFFNKRVTSVFSRKLNNYARKFCSEKSDIDELKTLFASVKVKRAKNITKIAYLVHLVIFACIMAISDYSVEFIVFSSMFLSVLWFVVIVVYEIFERISYKHEEKSRRRFLYILEHNINKKAENLEIKFDNCVVQNNDSLNELAKEIKDFIATNPNKSIAKVVLKSLYSANFSSALRDESIDEFKDSMLQLKNYVN